MDWQAAIEKQSEALRRILLALAAMAGLLDRSRFVLPPDIRNALFEPLSAAQDAAAQMPPRAGPHHTVAVARLRLRLVMLCSVVAGLRRRLLRPESNAARGPVIEVRRRLTGLRHFARRAIDVPDTS